MVIRLFGVNKINAEASYYTDYKDKPNRKIHDKGKIVKLVEEEIPNYEVAGHVVYLSNWEFMKLKYDSNYKIE